MSLHHGLTDSRDNHLTCFTDMLYSSIIPGILPSQLEILPKGQTHFETIILARSVPLRDAYCAEPVMVTLRVILAQMLFYASMQIVPSQYEH